MDPETSGASPVTAWQAGVVVPAHDEETVIGRCLAALAECEFARRLEVVVVANGCHDRTAEAARRFSSALPGLTVVELAQPGKIGALNAGDAVATAYPRIYLDADIVLDVGALGHLTDLLDGRGPLVASPQVRFDTHGATWLVRAWYRVFTRLPYVGRDLVGLGVYGLSEQGRTRFDSFPDVTGDDLFVQRLYSAEETALAQGHFVVRAPRRMTDLVAVRTRVARGNAELASLDLVADSATTTTSTVTALVDLVRRRPGSLPDVLVYVFVAAQARWRARTASTTWQRDASSRTAVGS